MSSANCRQLNNDTRRANGDDIASVQKVRHMRLKRAPIEQRAMRTAHIQQRVFLALRPYLGLANGSPGIINNNGIGRRAPKRHNLFSKLVPAKRTAQSSTHADLAVPFIVIVRQRRKQRPALPDAITPGSGAVQVSID
jgi:hypothetical protein